MTVSKNTIGGSTIHTIPCHCHLHKCYSFSQKKFFASDFLENALVILHFIPPFSVAKKHSLLYGKQWISWINMYGQMKHHLATCTPDTSNAFCNLCADSVENKLSGTTLCHQVSLGTFTVTPHDCKKWICRHFTPDNAPPHFLLAVHALLNVILKQWIRECRNTMWLAYSTDFKLLCTCFWKFIHPQAASWLEMSTDIYHTTQHLVKDVTHQGGSYLT
jgi:hypothetical protein